MKDQILKGILSFTGLSISIGVIGTISGLVGIFVDVNERLSIKWLLFVLLVGISLTIILLKIIYDLSQETRQPPPYENPFRYEPEEGVFVIWKNENFPSNIVVGCYAQKDGVDRLAYLGVVHIIQDKIIQIKIVADYSKLPSIPTTQEELKSISIRPVVPMAALQQFNTQENT